MNSTSCRDTSDTDVRDTVTIAEAQETTPRAISRMVRLSKERERSLSVNKDALSLSDPPLCPAQIPLYDRPRRSHRLERAADGKGLVTPQKSKTGRNSQPAAPCRRKAALLGEPSPGVTEGLPQMDLHVSKTRALSSAPGLMVHLPKGPHRHNSGKLRVNEQDLPQAGPPYEGMKPSSNLELVSLNAESNQHYTLCFETNHLPLALIDDSQTDLAAKSERAARLKSAERLSMPQCDQPAQSQTEFQQMINMAIPMEDETNIAKDGKVTTHNNTFRLCSVNGCSYLSYCVLTRKSGEMRLICHGTCSRFCQEVLCKKVLSLAVKSGSNGRFAYPVPHAFPRMTEGVWKLWKQRWQEEVRARQSITDAFESYRELYGQQAANEIQSLAAADPLTSAENPSYPNFAMRTKTGPLAESPPKRLETSGAGHVKIRSRISAGGSIPKGRPAWPRSLIPRERPAASEADTVLATEPAEAAVHLSAFTSTTGTGQQLNLRKNQLLHTWEESDKSDKDFSKSKSEKNRKLKEKYREISNQKKGPSAKRSKKSISTPKQARVALEREILADQTTRDEVFDHDRYIPDFDTFVQHHFSGNRLFIKAKSHDVSIAKRYMPISSAFELDSIQLYDYCEQQGLLTHHEIREVYDNHQPSDLSKLPLSSQTVRTEGLDKKTVRCDNPTNKGDFTEPEDLRRDVPKDVPKTTNLPQETPMEVDDQKDVQEHAPESGDVNVYMRKSSGMDRVLAPWQINEKLSEKLSEASQISRNPSKSDEKIKEQATTQERGYGHSSPAPIAKRESLSRYLESRRNPRNYESSDSENEDKKRKRIEKVHEDVIEGATSDTDDYSSSDSSSDESSNEQLSTKRSRKGRQPTPPIEKPVESDSDGGEWVDTASESDDSSSDSDLDIRNSQRKAYRRKKAEAKSKRHTRPRDWGRYTKSRSASPEPRRKSARENTKGKERDERSRSRSPVGRDHSRSPTRSNPTKVRQSNKAEAPWKADFERWSRKKSSKKQKASRRDKSAHDSPKRHKTVSKKKRRRSRQRESLSSLGATQEVEHAYLGALTSEMLGALDESSDESSSESSSEVEEMTTESATLAVSSSNTHSPSSTTSSVSDSEPPKEFFDNLLEQPEHRAKMKESGISRALYLEKVIKAPTKELGDMYYDLAKKRHDDREKEKVPRSLQYPERLSENAKFKAGSQTDSIQWRKLFMSECAFVKPVYLTPLCLRSALDPKVASAVRANFSREKFKGQYEAERSDFIPFESICKFLKKTYDRPGRKEAALLDYLTLYQGKGSVRDLITTRTNKLSILTRLGAKPLNSDLDRALVLRALSAPLSEFITSRPHHLSYSVDEIFRIAKTRELAVNNASRTSRNESLNSMDRRGGTSFRNRSNPNPRPQFPRNKGRFSQKGHLNAAIQKNSKRKVTSRRPNKASLFAFGNQNEQPRVSTRLFRTNYSDAEWNVRVGQDGRIKPGVNPKDPRHKNSFNKDTVQGKPWCLICKTSGHDMISCRAPGNASRGGKGKGKGKGKGGNRGGGRGQNRNFR